MRPPIKSLFGAILAFTAATVLMFGTLLYLIFGVIHLTGELHKQSGELHKQSLLIGNEYQQSIASCNRLQILRIEDNISHYADFKVISAVLAEARASGQQGSSPVLKVLTEALKAKSWIPITNCQEAVNQHGIRYRPPAPIKFYQRLPPASALKLSPRMFQ